MGLCRGGSVPASGRLTPVRGSGGGATRGLRANAGNCGRKSGGRGQKSGARRVPGRLRVGIGQVPTKIRDGVANRTGMRDGGIAQPASSGAVWAEMQSYITKQVNWLSLPRLMVLPFFSDGRTYPCDLLRNGDFPSARLPSIGAAAIRRRGSRPAARRFPTARRSPASVATGSNRPTTSRSPNRSDISPPRFAGPHARSRRPRASTGTLRRRNLPKTQTAQSEHISPHAKH